jgi:tetratricopeptide (TPR) repeat protein
MNSQLHSLILLGVLAAGVSQCLANTRWNSANAAYEKGKYEQAKADYIQMVDSREYSAELFYNLGNAWFKLNDHGRAIINYQRALILNPGFDEAKANLQTALKIVGNDDPKTIRDSFGVYADFFPVVASAGFWIALFCLFGWLQKGAPYSALCGFGSIAAGILAVSSLAISIWIGPGSKDSNRALVIESAADLKYGPAVTARPVESLQIGEPVHLISARGDWAFCRANTGNLGWIMSRKVERVLPQSE